MSMILGRKTRRERRCFRFLYRPSWFRRIKNITFGTVIRWIDRSLKNLRHNAPYHNQPTITWVLLEFRQSSGNRLSPTLQSDSQESSALSSSATRREWHIEFLWVEKLKPRSLPMSRKEKRWEESGGFSLLEIILFASKNSRSLWIAR